MKIYNYTRSCQNREAATAKG